MTCRRHDFGVSRPASPDSSDYSTERAANEPQIVWGQFVAHLPGASAPWLTLRAVDSTFWEVETEDAAVLAAIRTTFNDVRTGDEPID